jgi:uncharacterized phage protein (TIGR02218 family)
MKNASPALVALLDSNDRFIMVDLYSFTLVGGEVLRYSAAPTPVTLDGSTFVLGPKFERSRTKTVIGTQVDELQIRIYPEPTDRVGEFEFLTAMWLGFFDGALVRLERAFMPTYGDTGAGTVVLFAGRVSDIDCSRTAVDLHCRSHLELLNIQMPRRLWQSSCTHIFGDAMCQFDRSSLQQSFACLAGSTQSAIVTSVAPDPRTLFDQGTIIAQTGGNGGARRSIVQLSNGQVSIRQPFLSAITVGDQFLLLPGCDRSLATCSSAFDNLAHFGGFPFIPTPETAV